MINARLARSPFGDVLLLLPPPPPLLPPSFSFPAPPTSLPPFHPLLKWGDNCSRLSAWRRPDARHAFGVCRISAADTVTAAAASSTTQLQLSCRPSLPPFHPLLRLKWGDNCSRLSAWRRPDARHAFGVCRISADTVTAAAAAASEPFSCSRLQQQQPSTASPRSTVHCPASRSLSGLP